MMARWMLLLIFIIIGCSGQDASLKGRPKVVAAMGTVLYKGAPLADASVIFTNLESATTAYAQTDSAGNFKLTTFNKGDGAAPVNKLFLFASFKCLLKQSKQRRMKFQVRSRPCPKSYG